VTGSPEQIAEGAQHYGRFCGVCHGDAAYGGTLLPDLRRSPLLDSAKGWATVVRDGALQSQGMIGFASVLSPEQIDSIRAYLIKRANEDKALGEK
jgi:alcohol dehydrogenase (cytochrome c)/quinohemoprotein ethanol dehydrogenase